MKKLIIFLLIIIFFTINISCGGTEEEGLKPHEGAVTLDFSNDKKVYKLLIMDSQDKEPYLSARENMLSTLKKYGLEKGKNLIVKYYDIKNDLEKGKEILKREIPKFKPDVVFSNGTLMSRAARQTYLDNDKVNFVFACVSDPIGEKHIKDFGEPPIHNFTGVSYPVAVKSRLQFIKEIFPNAKKLAILHANMPQSTSYNSWVKKLVETDPEFKEYEVIFQGVPLITGEDSQEKMAKEMIPHVKRLNDEVDLFLAGNDQLGISIPLTKMVEKYATKPFNPLSKQAIMGKHGGVAAIYPSPASMGVQTGFMIMKLFKGVPIQKIPAEQPKKNGFAFDLKKAKKWGIEIPVKFIELAGKNIVR